MFWQHINPPNPELESSRGTALARFEPVNICFRDCFKMPRGGQVKNHCVGLRPAPPLAEARVTQLATASFRDKLALKALLQDLCKRPLGKISATDPYAMSLYKVSIRGVLSRSLQEASWKDQQSAQGPFSWCRKRGTKVVWGSPEGGPRRVCPPAVHRPSAGPCGVAAAWLPLRRAVGPKS